MKSNIVKLFITSASIASVLGLTSCKKYLQQDPITTFGTDYAFGSVADANNSVIGVYQDLTGDFGFGDRLSIHMPYDDDNMTTSAAANELNRGIVEHFNMTPPYTATLISVPWNMLYYGIERANICIMNIPQMDLYKNGSASDKASLQKLYGEALTLRALYYSELIKYWGDVPGNFVPTAYLENKFGARTDRMVVYKQILEDLRLAISLLPWRKDAAAPYDPDRITKGAAKAIRAKVALFAGGYSLKQDGSITRPANYKDYYDTARKECSELMARRDQHTLNPSYQSVFKDAICAHKFDPFGEILFEVGMGGASSKTDSKLGYDNGPKVTAGTNAGNGYTRVLPTYFYLFEATDKRRDVTIAPYNIEQTTGVLRPQTFTSIYDGKFRRDWTDNPKIPIDGTSAQYFGLNWPVIRFSDVLLMFAEAENEINGPAGAVAALNEVRARAGVGAVNPSSPSDMFNAIVDERAREFGGEGIRKYDLVRWNLLATKLTQTKAILDQIAAAIKNNTTLPAPYNNYPKVMYLKGTMATGITAGNSYYAPYTTSDPVPAGYTASDRVNWLTSVYSSSSVTADNPNGLAATFANYALGAKPVGPQVGFITGKHELLPIPTIVRDANINITQNKGY